jgi:multiple sugar transport system substrate-binding protein
MKMRQPLRSLLLNSVLITLGMCSAYSTVAATKLTLVEVITSPARTAMLQKMLSEYKTQHPETEIEVISLPWGQAFEKLGTMMQSGQVPDVVVCRTLGKGCMPATICWWIWNLS